MARARPVVVEDRRFQEHRAPRGHPERPERLEAVARAVAAREAGLRVAKPREAEEEELLRVHPAAHLARVREAVRRAPAHLDPDTYVSPESLHVARLAAGATIDLARAVVRGEAPSGLAAVRPPGHHAEADRAMGFCLFNNVAVAARALIEEEGVERIWILDWDVHHGNGTQHVFEEDPRVLYLSTHESPHYPGTGAFREAGRGPGLGTTLNVPMPAGCGDGEYLGLARRIWVPAARWYRPQVILVSCGFDAHAADPLAAMELSTAGYVALARIVRALADDLCDGRLVLVLEGGYDLRALEEGTGAVLDALLASEAGPLEEGPRPERGTMLHELIEQAGTVHPTAIPPARRGRGRPSGTAPPSDRRRGVPEADPTSCAVRRMCHPTYRATESFGKNDRRRELCSCARRAGGIKIRPGGMKWDQAGR